MLKKDKTKKTLKPSELSRACAEGRADEVHKLLRAPGVAAKLNKPDEQGITPLLLTCTFASTSTSEADLFNYLSICKMLVDSGADPTLGTASNTNYPLHILAKICISPSNASLKIFFESLLGYLISKGAEVNKLNNEGLTPLHEAARKGAADACACLLDKGAAVAARSGRGGMTPLHLAVSANHEPTVRALLRKGADPDLKCDSGSARDIAATLKLTRITQLIEQHEPSSKAAPSVSAAAGAAAVASNTVVGPAAEVQATVGPARATFQLSEGDINALVDAITSVEGGDSNANKSLPMPDLGLPPSMPPPDRPPSAVVPAPPPAAAADTDDYPVSDTADVKFLVDPSGQTTVRAATLDRLIERMTGLKDPEGSFVTAFLLTYRSFTPPVPLFVKLLARYRASDLETIQIRVLDIIKAWIDLHFYDFEDERELASALNDFCDSDVPPEHKVLLNTLKTSLRTQKERAAELAWQDVMAGAPNATSSLSFSELNVEDVAAQLTLVESRIYRRIRPKELLDQRWMKKGKEENSPNIMSMIQHFNHVTRWVQTEILNVSNLKRRAELLQKFVSLAREFRNRHNFNGVIEILAGLSTAAVRRLTNTWAQLDEATKAQLHELETLMSYQGSYKNYRMALRDAQPPCLPYLGMYLSDISFINEGQPNQTDGGLINFLKCSKIARVVAEIQYFQETSHSTPTSGITEREDIVTWWRATQAQIISERDAHAKSLKLESLGDKEDPEIALVEAANLRKENEELKLRVAQLEQLSHQQQDTIEKLTQKLNNMQREMRMTRDISQMLNAARVPAAKPSPTTLAVPQMSSPKVPAFSPRPTPTPSLAVELPPPPAVHVESEPESELEHEPEPHHAPSPVASESFLPQSISPRVAPPPAPVDDEVSATQKQLQENAAKLAELREKYKARQAGGDSAAATASASSPALARRAPEPAVASAPASSSPKSSLIKRPLVEPPKAKPPAEEVVAAPSGNPSAAAALREKFKLAGKSSSTYSAPGSTVVGPRPESTFSSTPGDSDASTSPSTEDPSALLERMRALRENYKRDGAAVPAASASRPTPGSEPAAPPSAASFSPPAGAVRVMPVAGTPPGKGRPLPKGPIGKK